MTPLDTAYAAMEAAPGDDTARLRFYERLAEGEVFLLLEAEAAGDTLAPRVFDLEEGPVVLAFDLEERLAAFTGIPAPYAA
ncbi:MAG TPA: SseB family protein, partial [Paracoccaceae bacterium]